MSIGLGGPSAAIEIQSSPTSIFAPRLQGLEHGRQMPGHDPGHRGRAACDDGRQQQRGRFDAVGNDAIGRRAELLHAFDAQGRRAQSFDASAQAAEKIAQVDDLRLDGRAGEDRGSLGPHGRTEDVGRPGHGGTLRPGQVDRSRPTSRRQRATT